jgi:import inner membrane translocase subunit TIM23
MRMTYINEVDSLSTTSGTASGNSGGLWQNIRGFLQVPHLLPEEGRHKLEFLFEEEEVRDPHTGALVAAPTGWSLGSRLCYGAGYTYLAFLTAGGLWGLTEGLRNPLGQSGARLRWACILNGVTARGPLLGNTAASAAVVYNGLHGLVLKAIGPRREGGLTAGTCAAATGALFNASLGTKAALRGAGLLAVFVLAYRHVRNKL